VDVADDQPAKSTGVNPEAPGTPTAQVLSYLEGYDQATYPDATPTPFSVNVIADFVGPVHTGGVPLNAANNPGLFAALDHAFRTGTECSGGPCGSLNMEGFTHQNSKTSSGDLSQTPSTTDKVQADPYDGISGDDYEFFHSYCVSRNPGTATTYPPPGRVSAARCRAGNSPDWVYLAGPLLGDSAGWAASRINQAAAILENDGWLASPPAGQPYAVNFITPHYAASATDYQAFAPLVQDRYDRALYYSGQLSGAPVTKNIECDAVKCNYIGQFFPDAVTDVYGSVVLPENLGDYEWTTENQHPPRLPLDLVYEAQENSVLTDGTASFFYDAEDAGVSPLATIVSGIKNLGYTFVSPAQELTDYTSSLSAPPTVPPAVSAVNPPSGPSAGTNTVTITGSGFTGATAVDFGSTPVSSYTVDSDTTITATVPPGTGQVHVAVVVGGASSAPMADSSSADLYTYTG
jgi:hypothetical protein